MKSSKLIEGRLILETLFPYQTLINNLHTEDEERVELSQDSGNASIKCISKETYRVVYFTDNMVVERVKERNKSIRVKDGKTLMNGEVNILAFMKASNEMIPIQQAVLT